MKAILIAAALILLPVAGSSQLPFSHAPLRVIQGPVDADVTRIIDGDTFTFIAMPWPEMTVSGTLRMDGIDTPEKNGKCALEKKRAGEATTFLLNTIAANKGRVRLYVVGLVGEDGGGFGRYRAQVRIGNDWLSEMMISQGFARENHGEPRKSWCG